MDRLDTLKAFVAVADHGSFAAAARTLRLSASAVSRAVAALEARLGIPLMQRTTRSVRLTDEGALFLPRCRDALLGLEDAERVARGASLEPGGHLTVAAPVLWGRLHAVPVVVAMLAAYPRLVVQLKLSDRLVSLADEGIDIAMRIGELSDSALRAVRLGGVKRVLAASPAYLDRQGIPASVDDLRQHDIIAFSGTSPLDEWRFGSTGKLAVTLRPRLLVDSAEAAIDAVVRGAGIGRFLSYQVEDHVGAGRLRLLLSEHDPPLVPVSLVFQTNRAASPSIRAFIDASRAHLGKVTAGEHA